jgi:hypothetical protein
MVGGDGDVSRCYANADPDGHRDQYANSESN